MSLRPHCMQLTIGLLIAESCSPPHMLRWVAETTYSCDRETSTMTSSAWWNVILSLCLYSQTDSLTPFCPLMSPIDGVVYVVDRPSSSMIGQTLSQCVLACFSSTSDNSGATCRCLNYNTTSMNCSLFNFDPLRTSVNVGGVTVAYQVGGRNTIIWSQNVNVLITMYVSQYSENVT